MNASGKVKKIKKIYSSRLTEGTQNTKTTKQKEKEKNKYKVSEVEWEIIDNKGKIPQLLVRKLYFFLLMLYILYCLI